MKKLMVGAALRLAACTPPKQEGTYVAHYQHEYAAGDDTLVVRGNVVTKRTGYQRKRNGKLLPKQSKITRWRLNDPMTPVIGFKEDGLVLGDLQYQKIE